MRWAILGLCLVGCGGTVDDPQPTPITTIVEDASDAGQDAPTYDAKQDIQNENTPTLCCTHDQNVFPCDIQNPWTCDPIGSHSAMIACAGDIHSDLCKVGIPCYSPFGQGVVVDCNQ